MRYVDKVQNIYKFCGKIDILKATILPSQDSSFSTFLLVGYPVWQSADSCRL